MADETDVEDIPQDSGDAFAFSHPLVAGSSRSGAWVLGGAALALGALTFAALGFQRANGEQANALPIARNASATIAAPDLPRDLAEFEASAAAPPAPAFVIPTALPMPVAVTPVSSTRPGEGVSRERRQAPALIIDLAQSGANPAAASGETGTASGQGGLSRAAAAGDLDEQFAARAAAGESDTAVATVLRNRSAIVPQGAFISGVLETALNSDLPGYARAIVSRDVRSFDGTRVLIPRGSRLIGQYSSGVSLGQSRLFVVWTRIITPEGVSIQIGSPGTDDLGRGGLAGRVDRHFFERFGGALLLTVVNAAGAAIADGPNMQVIIGSAQDATRGANPTDIAPTIDVRQGAPIRVFVVRDLDFTQTLARTSGN